LGFGFTSGASRFELRAAANFSFFAILFPGGH
jgi:hypothetical protein